jgi:flagella basal body P-ring formation protein FlgA
LSAVTVDGNLVRIGDLVENAGAAADIPIFRAPDLGETGAVPASRVLDAVRPHGLIGIETRGLAEISVTRASRAITREEIEARLGAAIAVQTGLPGIDKLALSFDREAPTLYLEPAARAELEITRISYDRRSGRFDASMTVPGSELMRRAPLRLTGTAVETREVATLARRLTKGETLTAADIVIQRRPLGEVPSDALETRDQAVGQTAKRPLQPGQALRAGDLMRPELVQRDHVVSLIYEAPGILLSMRAKALESGGQGEVINVLNMQSKRTLQATIIGPGQVAITPPEPVAEIGRSAQNSTDGSSISAE